MKKIVYSNLAKKKLLLKIGFRFMDAIYSQHFFEERFVDDILGKSVVFDRLSNFHVVVHVGFSICIIIHVRSILSSCLFFFGSYFRQEVSKTHDKTKNRPYMNYGYKKKTPHKTRHECLDDIATSIARFIVGLFHILL